MCNSLGLVTCLGYEIGMAQLEQEGLETEDTLKN